MSKPLQHLWRPRLAIIEPLALANEVGQRVRRNLLRLGTEVVLADRAEGLGELDKAREVPARSYLLVRARPHRSIRAEQFPSMSTRPNHYFMTLGVNCSFACEYCYLYANSARIRPAVIYTDLDRVKREILEIIGTSEQRLVFNMGEDHDSLAFEHLAGTASDMVDFFGELNADLELRTKSGLTPSLLEAKAPRRATIAASLLPHFLASKYDHRTAPTRERLLALSVYASAGYSIALKFEPGLLEGDWKREYTELVDEAAFILRRAVPSHASVGCFRYRSELGEAIARNFPRNELVRSADREYVPARFSYSDGLRSEFYEHLIFTLRRYWQDLPIYLSMESVKMCKRFGANPWVPQESLQAVEATPLVIAREAVIG